MTIYDALKTISNNEDLDENTTYEVMTQIMNGEVSDVAIASFLTGLRVKGEIVDEIYAASKVLRDKVDRVYTLADDIVDTCGTGGSGISTFNISTTAMFIAASCGVKIAKHGNRSATSKSGAADVLEALGVNINLNPKDIQECINDIGVGFMFAQKFHSAVKYVMPVRKELAFKTIFNILGPLSNPAFAKRQLLGVYDKSLVLKMAQVLKRHGAKRAMVVHGEDGLDEITLTGNTYVAELKDDKIREYVINPKEFGLNICTLEQLKGGDKEENAQITKQIFSGEEGPKTDIAILNAGAVIYVSGKAETLDIGIEMARNALKDKKVNDIFEKFIERTNLGMAK